MKQIIHDLAVAKCNRPHRYIKQDWLEELTNTQFITRCRTGQISREELNTFVEQHQIYSRGFTRYLGALLANIENDEFRLVLTRNLFDEMGFGDAGNMPHSKLYRKMMESLGLIPEQTPLPSTQLLIDTMFECCQSPSYMVGLGALCLGAEELVPYMYQPIVDGFLALGESLKKLEFFTLHIECDEGHADAMYAIIDQKLQENPESLLDLNYGAEKLIQARIRFFEGLSVC
jgi:pyrroloquinoline quinone (PQQ) biosynthesis protein C